MPESRYLLGEYYGVSLDLFFFNGFLPYWEWGSLSTEQKLNPSYQKSILLYSHCIVKTEQMEKKILTHNIVYFPFVVYFICDYLGLKWPTFGAPQVLHHSTGHCCTCSNDLIAQWWPTMASVYLLLPVCQVRENKRRTSYINIKY